MARPKIIYDFDANSVKLVSEIEKSRKALQGMKTDLSLIKFDSIINLAERAYQAGEKIYGLAKSTASALNEIEKMAKVANMSTDQYQKMAYAAKMSDVSIEELSTGMKKLSINMDEAEKAGGPAAEKFERIGVSVKDSEGKMKGLNQIMLEIANKFSTWEDGPRKIAIAVDLFGRSGERLIPYLNQGAAGIKGFYEEAEKLGIVLDEKVIKAGGELENRLKKAEAWYSSLWHTIVIGGYEAVKALENYISISKGLEINPALFVTSFGMQGVRKKESRPDLLDAEKAGDEFLKLEASYKRTAAPISPEEDRKKAEKELKIYREVNTQLLKDQEATLKRMVDLQTQLNKSGNEAIDIANRLGIGTKAALTQWVETDMVGEYEKLLGSKLFSGEEMEQFKGKYTEALQGAMGEGGWGAEYKQIEEAIKRINTMKVEDTSIQKVRNDLEELRKESQYFEKFTGSIKMDDDDVVRAMGQIDELRTKLTDLVNESWNVTMSIYGYGSARLPISEKIAEIDQKFGALFEGISGKSIQVKVQTNTIDMRNIMGEVSSAFQQMGPVVGKAIQGYNQEDITNAIASHEADIMKAYSPKTGTSSSSPYWKKMNQEIIANAKAQIEKLQGFQTTLSQVGSYAATQAIPAAASEGGGGGSYGGGGGGVTVNIGTIYVNGENSEVVAAGLDAQLADLYLRDRSKLKNAIESTA